MRWPGHLTKMKLPAVGKKKNVRNSHANSCHVFHHLAETIHTFFMPYQILYYQHEKYFNFVSEAMNRTVTACSSSFLKKYGPVITVGDIINQT